jgi:hypothetical protein
MTSGFKRAWIVPLKTIDFAGRHNRFAEFWFKNEMFVPFHLKGSIEGHPRMAQDGVVRQDSREPRSLFWCSRPDWFCKERAERLTWEKLINLLRCCASARHLLRE